MTVSITKVFGGFLQRCLLLFKPHYHPSDSLLTLWGNAVPLNVGVFEQWKPNVLAGRLRGRVHTHLNGTWHPDRHRNPPLLQDGENYCNQDQTVHRSKARNQRFKKEGDRVPAESALCGKLHPEYYFHSWPCSEARGQSGSGRRWTILHERRYSVDHPNCGRKWG